MVDMGDEDQYPDVEIILSPISGVGAASHRRGANCS